MTKHEESTERLKGRRFVLHHGAGTAYISRVKSERVEKLLDREDGIHREAFGTFSDAKAALLERLQSELKEAQSYVRMVRSMKKTQVGDEDW